MARFSTGLRNAIASSYGLGAMMNGGVIRVYGGNHPTTPDMPADTEALGVITTDGKSFTPIEDPNGAGLLLKLISPGALVNDGVWKLKGIAEGAATWWRWHWSYADDLLLSEYYPRVDGSIGAELKLQNTYIRPTTFIEIEQFLFVLGMGV